jgi:mannosyl-3-phosphoglycerate synthase
MYIGILLAKMLNKRYVGFIDADNYIPGAVHEYIEIYAAGFILTQRPYSMVRISWVYKPKVVDQKIFFPKWGRVSEITNKHLNQLIESYTGFGTEIIKTANAGEHAMSMQLADVLTYSAGFSGETFELVNMLEQFGGIKSSPHPEVMSSGVDVYQVETRNPHLHEEKEESHLAEMLSHSLGALHNSEICPQTVRDQIAQSIPVNGIRLMNKIKPPCDMDFNRFSDELKSKSESLTFFK